MRAALIRSASTSVRPPAVGCVSSLSCAFLPPRRAPTIYAGCLPSPAGCACAMNARAREWVGDWAPARCQPMDPSDTDHCHLSRRGRVPDEKTPGHEATPPSHTYTHRQGCGSPTSERASTNATVDSWQRSAAHVSAWRSGTDASSPGPSRLSRVRVQTSPQTPLAQAVEVAPDAHGGQRRPSCVRVCCRTRAPRPGPACIFCDYPQFIEIPDIHTTAPKLMSPHSNSLKCRRLGTAATTDVQSALVRPPPALTGR
ncbi:hypothetical protein EVAR_19270_1 [Eumeta japonica]|uniref:Uncharacterized protein n=1 Tax=Eumeta variegata TaxID=151549 RepID=A0A4C1UD72_EUMVA|nr:hypothetical protein EVAR_19270_1 [Eumeta japonica]